MLASLEIIIGPTFSYVPNEIYVQSLIRSSRGIFQFTSDTKIFGRSERSLTCSKESCLLKK